MRYILVHHTDSIEFSNKINQALDDGFKLHGGPFATRVGEQNQSGVTMSIYTVFYQAMVKDDE